MKKQKDIAPGKVGHMIRFPAEMHNELSAIVREIPGLSFNQAVVGAVGNLLQDLRAEPETLGRLEAAANRFKTECERVFGRGGATAVPDTEPDVAGDGSANGALDTHQTHTEPDLST